MVFRVTRLLTEHHRDNAEEATSVFTGKRDSSRLGPSPCHPANDDHQRTLMSIFARRNSRQNTFFPDRISAEQRRKNLRLGFQ